MNQAYGQTRVDLVIKDQYYNMRQVIEKNMMPVELAKEVMEDLGIVPVIEPIRGGTDGSKISFMGIPTPNLLQVVKICMVVMSTFLCRQWKKL